MIIPESKALAHYGIKTKSGRYPWGSGEDPLQRSKTFTSQVQKLKDAGLSEAEIYKGFGMTSGEFRTTRQFANTEIKAERISTAQRLRDTGMSTSAIGREMGINESSVRSLLAPGQKDKLDILETTTNLLRDKVGDKDYVDVGTGQEINLGISKEKLNSSLSLLKEEGYVVRNVQVDQYGTNQKTTVRVLAPPGTTYKDINMNKGNIKQINEHSEDGGRSYLGIAPPLSISSSRVGIKYKEDGGAEADGVMFVRPGVKDVDLGGSKYAQVRVAVDGTHYLKGMAVYKKDLPDGVDIVFNTNKAKADIGTDKLAAMKKMKRDDDGNIDKENPFGSMISRQMTAKDKNGNDVATSAMNLVKEEGGWEKQKKTIASQVLSKQPPTLAKQQLKAMYDRKKAEFDEINALTNPAVKRKLLEAFSDDVDSSAVHMKAAALPRTAWHVILPVKSLKSTEVYAPNYKDGERVALIRYPHGGKFEIPELTVNNRNREGISLLGKNARDAVGINSKVAERLSGADFDGDTVLIIPNNKGQIKTSPALKGLEKFDPQTTYKGYEGMKPMSARTKQIQMGVVSNLITDMTIKGAKGDELARAVRHSMVVIDAEKHNLNYRQSAKDNNISQLQAKYQGKAGGSAATLISRAKKPTEVNERKSTYRIDPATGKKIYTETGNSYVNRKTGEVVVAKSKVSRIMSVDDAKTLSSGTVIESVYAQHSNDMRSLANQARKVMVNTKSTPYSPAARKAYESEVKSLDAKLKVALQNAPRERAARLIADTNLALKKAQYPDMDRAQERKIAFAALEEARLRVNPKGKTLVDITDNEWKAIQAGAITNNKLTEILRNSDIERVKELATPRTQVLMSPTKQRRAEQMLNSGATQAEVAEALGVSVSTLKNSLGGE